MTQQDAESTRRRPPLIAVAITVAAVALALVHSIGPDVEIDAVTVTLAIVALVPWLGPIFKSIELPGGWKLEFQDLKREVRGRLDEAGQRVDTLADRVDRVERLAFSPTVAPEVAEALEGVVSRFHDHLVAVGLGDTGSVPSVRITDDSQQIDNAYYDPAAREIVLGRHLANDPDVMLREYTHHLLVGGYQYEVLSPAATALESGLADYLPCSFTGDPALGRKIAGILGLESPWIRNLENDRTSSSIQRTVQDAGEVWGGGLWEVRTLLGREEADAAALIAWQQADPPRARGFAKRFVAALASAVPTREAAIRKIFDRRGLMTYRWNDLGQ